MTRVLFPHGDRTAGGRAIQARTRPRSWPYTCGIKDLDGTLVLVSRKETSGDVRPVVQGVEKELASVGRPRKGPAMVIVTPRSAQDRKAGVAVESVDVMVPVAPGMSAPPGFEAVIVPSQPVAYTIHHGNAADLSSAEAVLADWVQMKALRRAGAMRRIYVKQGKNPKKDITEIQIPLER